MPDHRLLTIDESQQRLRSLINRKHVAFPRYWDEEARRWIGFVLAAECVRHDEPVRVFDGPMERMIVTRKDLGQ